MQPYLWHLQLDSITMSPPKLPLEILLMIARLLTNDEGKLCFADFNSFLKVNRALYGCLNRTLWHEATEVRSIADHVFTRLLRTNDLVHLNFFLELGADIETALTEFVDGSNRWKLQITPLKAAVNLENVQMARLLLEHGANLVQCDKLGRPCYGAIHAARSAEMVQLLLDHHADPEQQIRGGLRPLHFYAERGNIEAMRTVLRNGVEVDPSGDISSRTPLHYAAEHNIDAVKLLLEHGAEVKKKTGLAEETPLHWAAKAGKTDVAKLLLERWPEGIREKNAYGNTPLHLADEADKIDVVRLLLGHWRDVDSHWQAGC
jgi:ankyrin repeat protein